MIYAILSLISKIQISAFFVKILFVKKRINTRFKVNTDFKSDENGLRFSSLLPLLKIIINFKSLNSQVFYKSENIIMWVFVTKLHLGR